MSCSIIKLANVEEKEGDPPPPARAIIRRRKIGIREKQLLMEIVNSDPDMTRIIQGGQAATNMDKHHAWLRITDTFNQGCGRDFSAIEMRTLYDRIKNRSKKVDGHCQDVHEQSFQLINEEDLEQEMIEEGDTEHFMKFNFKEDDVEENISSSNIKLESVEEKQGDLPPSRFRRRKIKDREKELLLEIFERDPDTNKKMQEGTTSNMERHHIWLKITDTLNQESGQDFSVIEVRALYGRIKSENKKVLGTEQQFMQMEEGGRSELPTTTSLSGLKFTIDEGSSKTSFQHGCPQTTNNKMPSISTFHCVSSNLSLNILDFNPKQANPTKYKSTLSTPGDKEVHLPALVSVQRLEKKDIKSEDILKTLRQLSLCPGMAENRVLPLLSHFGNVNFACVMFLIEQLGQSVVYRSRECELFTVEQEEQLCSSCRDLFGSLEKDLTGKISEALIPVKEIKEDVQGESEHFVEVSSKENIENEDFIKTSKKRPKKCSNKYSCKMCSRQFGLEKSLAYHCKIFHKNEYLKDCPFCDNKFGISEGLGNLYTHLTTVHELLSESGQYQEIAKKYLKSKRYCAECGKTFKTRGNWEIHMAIKHSPPQYTTCHVCGKSVKDDAFGISFNGHLDNHITEEAICPKCGASLKNKKYLKAHMEIHNGTLIPCETCGKQFTRKRSLQEHVKFVHLKKRSFKCEHCDKRFPQSGKLRHHIMAIHTKEKPLFCELCEYRCVRADSLRSHMKSNHSAQIVSVFE